MCEQKEKLICIDQIQSFSNALIHWNLIDCFTAINTYSTLANQLNSLFNLRQERVVENPKG